MSEARFSSTQTRGGSSHSVLSSRLVIVGALVVGLWVAASLWGGRGGQPLLDRAAEAAPAADDSLGPRGAEPHGIPADFEPAFPEGGKTSGPSGRLEEAGQQGRRDDRGVAGGPVRVNPLSLVAKLALVVALAYLAVAGLRRWSGRRALTEPGDERRLRVLERLSLGANREVVLLEAGGREIVIGADPQGVTLLADLQKKPPERPMEEEAPSDEPLPEWFWRPRDEREAKKRKPDDRRQKQDPSPESRARRRDMLLEALHSRPAPDRAAASRMR